MTQQLQELLNKIKTEGIQAADDKAKEIEIQAQAKSRQIIEQAQKEAAHILQSAQGEVKRIRESTQIALQQASRDTLLSLRKQIEQILARLIQAKTGEALSSDVLSEILTDVIKKSLDAKSLGSLEITLNAQDLEKVKNGFSAHLKEQIKKGVRFQSSQDSGKGFTISFDSGKSSFEFTDQSLAEFFSSFLSVDAASFVNDAVKSK
jgi:V/A-type H+-transporting ATPase subunit E